MDDGERFLTVFLAKYFSSSEDLGASDSLRADETGDKVGGVLVESFLGENGLHGSNTGGERSEDEELEVLCLIFELQSNFNRFSLTLLSSLLLSQS